MSRQPPRGPLRQLIAYLTGPGTARLPWVQHEGADGRPYWTARDRYGRTWWIHPPDPHRLDTYPAALRTAVTTVAAAERRPLADVLTDLTAGSHHPRPATDTLVDTWRAAAPRPGAVQVVTAVSPPGSLTKAIDETFTAGYRHGWQQQAHHLLFNAATSTLSRLRHTGHPPTTEPPHTTEDLRPAIDQITTGSAERYLTDHHWQLLDATPPFRRWRAAGPGSPTITMPTSHGDERQWALTAATIAEWEGRDTIDVIADLAEPALADPHLAKLHHLLTHLPAPTVTAARTRLADLTVETTPGQPQPLPDFARHQIATLGASDAVWYAAAHAGASDATAQAANVLDITPTPPPPLNPVRFCRRLGEPPEQIAARIWAAGGHLPPATHARHFLRTWWPYHLTATIHTTAAQLASQLGQPPSAADLPAATDKPTPELLRRIDKTSQPDLSETRRFIAAFRAVDHTARQTAADLVLDWIGQHSQTPPETVSDQPATDARHLGQPPSDHALQAALRDAAAQQPPPAAGHTTATTPHHDLRQLPPAATATATHPPPWKAILDAAAKPPPPGDPTPQGTDQARQQQLQQVRDAVNAITRTSGGTQAR